MVVWRPEVAVPWTRAAPDPCCGVAWWAAQRLQPAKQPWGPCLSQMLRQRCGRVSLAAQQLPQPQLLGWVLLVELVVLLAELGVLSPQLQPVMRCHCLTRLQPPLPRASRLQPALPPQLGLALQVQVAPALALLALMPRQKVPLSSPAHSLTQVQVLQLGVQTQRLMAL